MCFQNEQRQAVYKAAGTRRDEVMMQQGSSFEVSKWSNRLVAIDNGAGTPTFSCVSEKVFDARFFCG